MARGTVEDCLEELDNSCALVLLATGRTRQLMKGSRSLVENQKNKEPVIALREIAGGLVRFDRPVRSVLDRRLSELQAEYEAAHGIHL